jgi:hypothetical protein
MLSAEHFAVKKQKSLYCEACKTQCRTAIELAMHKNTKKHKQAEAGDEEKDEFHCEACAYTTEIKQRYETHLKTKKHQSKVSA